MSLVDYLTHYYLSDHEPFMSLSALVDGEAMKIMEALCDDTPFGSRFKDPLQYLQKRRETERWVRGEFAAKGGKPQASYPIPMVLGSSRWMVDHAPDPDRHGEIRIPLSVFAETDISFTVPDSMISRWFALEKHPEYYQSDLHDQIFTLSEILSIVDHRGMPEEDWQTNLPDNLAPYIEAQVWRYELLTAYKRGS